MMKPAPTSQVRVQHLCMAICIQCGADFAYKSKGRKRQVCNVCWEENRSENVARRDRSFAKRPTEDWGQTLDAQGITRMRRGQVARMHGVTNAAVWRTERRALLKIRNNPEARELFQQWKEDGCPTPVAVDRSEQMLEWHMQLSDFWSLYDRLVGEGCIREASECLAEIRRVFRMVKRALNERLQPYG